MQDSCLLQLVDAMYAAALDAAQWPAVLAQYTRLYASQAASFWVLTDQGGPALPVFSYQGFDPGFIRDYLSEYVASDPTVQYLLRHPDQTIVHDGLVISEREKDRHPYYDWHGRHSDTRFRLVGRTVSGTGLQAGVALHRVARSGAFQAHDIKAFEQVQGHLQRALEIAFRLATLDSPAAPQPERLHHSDAAIVVLDAAGRTLMANDAAMAIDRLGDGLQVGKTGVLLHHPQSQRRLRDMVAQCMTLRAGRWTGSALQLCVPRLSGRRPFLVQVMPGSALRQACRLPPGATAAVCLIISDLDRATRVDKAWLRREFGLTPAEAQLAWQLAQGQDLGAAAVRLGIQLSTARARLQQLLMKTGTRRQADLLLLLARLECAAGA